MIALALPEVVTVACADRAARALVLGSLLVGMGYTAEDLDGEELILREDPYAAVLDAALAQDGVPC